jgi:transcriptional regulator with XRE-family HTH domain
MKRKKKLNPVEIGERIKEIRGEKTLEEFGELLGVKNPTVYRYETDRVPDADTLIAIAALDPKRRGVEWILTGALAENVLTEGQVSIYKDVASEPALPGLAWNEPPEMYTKDPRRQEQQDPDHQGSRLRHEANSRAFWPEAQGSAAPASGKGDLQRLFLALPQDDEGKLLAGLRLSADELQDLAQGFDAGAAAGHRDDDVAGPEAGQLQGGADAGNPQRDGIGREACGLPILRGEGLSLEFGTEEGPGRLTPGGIAAAAPSRVRQQPRLFKE